MSNPELHRLPLFAIRIDGDTQLREETRTDIVQAYAEDMQAGDIFPPITVFNDGISNWLADGYHRYFAVQACGLGEITAHVRQGTRRDALLYAAEANRKHGLSFSNKDKRRIVTLFLNDREWSQWSDREIARRCGVSNTFVSSQRAQLSTVDSEMRTYTTRHGTQATMNVARIGNDPYEGLSEYVIKELEQRDASHEAIADIATYARQVKADIKKNAAKALLIGSCMLCCQEGDTPRVGDPPYTREQLEKEGWELWRLVPSDIDTFLEVGELQRLLHEKEVSRGKDFFEVTDEDILQHCSYGVVTELAQLYVTIMFRCCNTIWHYLTFGLSQEAKEQLLTKQPA